MKMISGISAKGMIQTKICLKRRQRAPRKESHGHQNAVNILRQGKRLLQRDARGHPRPQAHPQIRLLTTGAREGENNKKCEIVGIKFLRTYLCQLFVVGLNLHNLNLLANKAVSKARKSGFPITCPK